jgi:long-chain acyl-CoA synthetase
MSKAPWIRFYRNGRLSDVLTFDTLDQRVDDLCARYEKMGLKTGDRVIVALNNSIDAVITYLALLRAQIIAVPVNPNESAAWLNYVREHSGACALVTKDGITDIKDNHHRYGSPSSQVSTIIYTSGTTGSPKGVSLGWKNWKANGTALNQHHRVDSHTIHASPLPLYHCNAHGFSMFGTYLAKCTWVMFDGVEPDFLQVIDSESAEIVSLVPPLLEKLLRANSRWKPHSGLRSIITAAAPLSGALLREVLDSWNVRVIQGYGLSESTNFSCTMPVDLPDDLYRKVMLPNPSVGVALPGIEVRVGEDDKEELVGELQIRSSSNCLGYWGDDSPSGEWIRTGDLGYYRTIERARFYYLTGRIKEQINRGGETISPVFIEEELRMLGLDGDFAVVPIPDPRLGEEVGLASAGHVESRLLQGVPWHRRPKRVFIVDNIPLTPSGKVQRTRLSEMIKNSFL